MDTAVVAPPPENAAPATPPRKAGRPHKYVVPTDGTPLTPKMQAVLRDRERKRLAYEANPARICAQNYRNFAARQARQRDALRQFEELKRTLAALATAVAGGEPVAMVLPQLRAAAGG